MLLRRAGADDRAFIVEMARLACSLEGRHPVPAAGELEVTAMLPRPGDVAHVALDASSAALLGAAWCHVHSPPLLLDDAGRPLPELVMAVEASARGRGVGAALIEAVAADEPTLSLNVHLLNPAVRLYVRGGFRVAGRGRGWYGVAMLRARDT
jgi:GNAT superfamily N-acetyltransferase